MKPAQRQKLFELGREANRAMNSPMDAMVAYHLVRDFEDYFLDLCYEAETAKNTDLDALMDTPIDEFDFALNVEINALFRPNSGLETHGLFAEAGRAVMHGAAEELEHQAMIQARRCCTIL